MAICLMFYFQSVVDNIDDLSADSVSQVLNITTAFLATDLDANDLTSAIGIIESVARANFTTEAESRMVSTERKMSLSPPL